MGHGSPSVDPAVRTTFRSRAVAFSRYWLPVLLWAAAIFTGSSDTLSSNNTSRFLEPLIHWVFRGASAEAIDAVMIVVRKSGHLTEYAILSVLCWRAVRRPVRGDARTWSWREAAVSLTMAAVYAASDEFHQRFVPSRTASPWDVLVDACGAVIGLALIWSLRQTGSRS
jgi:VanZ family protein